MGAIGSCQLNCLFGARSCGGGAAAAVDGVVVVCACVRACVCVCVCVCVLEWLFCSLFHTYLFHIIAMY